MRKILIPAFIVIALLLSTGSVSAATQKVMWGKTELKKGQIGKVTILSNTKLVKLDNDGNLSVVRTLKKGEEYRVYSYKSNLDGLYGVGGGNYIHKNISLVKYETPSKRKLELLERLQIPVSNGYDGIEVPELNTEVHDDFLDK